MDINLNDKELKDMIENIVQEKVKNRVNNIFNGCFSKKNYLEELITIKTKRNRSVVSLIESVISDLPKQAEAAMNIVNNFDKNKFQEVINFAQAANGGRPIL